MRFGKKPKARALSSKESEDWKGILGVMLILVVARILNIVFNIARAQRIVERKTKCFNWSIRYKYCAKVIINESPTSVE